MARILGEAEQAIWAVAFGDKRENGQNRFIVVLADPPQRPQPVLTAGGDCTNQEERSVQAGGGDTVATK